MEQPYTSIKQEVLRKLKEQLPFLESAYGVKTIGVFGSVSRGKDTPESDIDMLVTFLPEHDSYHTYLDLVEYLERLFHRRVELITERSLHPLIRQYVEADIIWYQSGKGVA